MQAKMLNEIHKEGFDASEASDGLVNTTPYWKGVRI
jgi:hypothetical protein